MIFFVGDQNLPDLFIDVWIGRLGDSFALLRFNGALRLVVLRGQKHVLRDVVLVGNVGPHFLTHLKMTQLLSQNDHLLVHLPILLLQLIDRLSQSFHFSVDEFDVLFEVDYFLGRLLLLVSIGHGGVVIEGEVLRGERGGVFEALEIVLIVFVEPLSFGVYDNVIVL